MRTSALRTFFETIRSARRRTSADVRLPEGLAVTVHAAPCLFVEASVACFVRVLAGHAWITADGKERDTIAAPGTIVSLEPGFRFTFTALRDQATVLFAASRRRREVDFSLRTRAGLRLLTISPCGGRVIATFSRRAADIMAFARRRLALPGPGTL